MLFIIGIITVIITLFSIETHLRKVTKQNEKIIELLKNMK